MAFTFWENALIPHSKTPGWKCFENPFPSTAERGGENYDLLYQNSIGKYKDDLEH